MNDAAIEHLAAAQGALIDALDAGDLTLIEAASAAVSHAIAQVRSAGGWRPTPQLKDALHTALRTGEGARVRTNYLADHGRRRLQALDTIAGGARSAYGRAGR